MNEKTKYKLLAPATQVYGLDAREGEAFFDNAIRRFLFNAFRYLYNVLSFLPEEYM